MKLAKCKKCGADADIDADINNEFYCSCRSGSCWLGPVAATLELAAEAWNAVMGEPKPELDEKPKTCGECAYMLEASILCRFSGATVWNSANACPAGVKRNS